MVCANFLQLCNKSLIDLRFGDEFKRLLDIIRCLITIHDWPLCKGKIEQARPHGNCFWSSLRKSLSSFNDLSECFVLYFQVTFEFWSLSFVTLFRFLIPTLYYSCLPLWYEYWYWLNVLRLGYDPKIKMLFRLQYLRTLDEKRTIQWRLKRNIYWIIK